MTLPFAADRLYSALLTDPTHPVIVADRSGTSIWVNDVGAALGWKSGDDVRLVLSPDDRHAYSTWTALFDEGTIVDVLGAVRPDTGNAESVRWRLVVPEHDPSKVVWLGSDATEDFALARALADRTLDLDELVQLGIHLSDATTGPAILERLAASLKLLAGTDAVFLSVFTDNSRTFFHLEPSGLIAIDPTPSAIERSPARQDSVFIVRPQPGDFPFSPDQALMRQALCGVFTIDRHQHLVTITWRLNEIRANDAVRLPIMMAAGRQAALALARTTLLTRLEHQSLTDPLTGLDNRRSFFQQLPQMFDQAQFLGQQLALFMIDTDDFKQINDRLGHAAGDEALSCVAQHLRRLTRSGDLVARIGGDEFVVALIVPDIDAAIAIASRMVDKSDPFAMTRPGLTVGVAIGDGRDSLLGQADAALYEAKTSEKGSWCLWQPGLHIENPEMCKPVPVGP